MTDDRFQRTRLLLGDGAMEKLARSRVAVFGLGGVGGYAAEALARTGVGALELIDGDRVTLSNLNRQILGLESTLGVFKTQAAKERISEINPGCKVTIKTTFFLPSSDDGFNFEEYDYVIDAIDTVAGKLAIIARARAAGTPVISAMGAGNKLDPTAFKVADIYSTSVCPLAKVMRRELKKMGVESLKVVYSEEEPKKRDPSPELSENPSTQEGGFVPSKKATPGSVAFVPPVMGLILAGEVIKDLIR